MEVIQNGAGRGRLKQARGTVAVIEIAADAAVGAD